MAAYSPTMAAIRYGYGLSPAENTVERVEDLLAQLEDAGGVQPLLPRGGIGAGRQRALQLAEGLAAIKPVTKGGEPDRKGRKLLQQKANTNFQADCVARVQQAVSSPYGLHERLAAFWFDHFSVNAQKSLPMRLLVPLYEAEAIRPHVGGDFRDILKAAILHPAMLIYLDQSRSTGPLSVAGQNRKSGLNENLGRELLELHTLGAGSGYSQDDVRSAALVLTGTTVDKRYDMLFRPRMAEPGAIEVLGVSYGGRKRTASDSLTMLDDLASRPETAQHICRKLCSHFIADAAPAEVVKAMVGEWNASGGNLTRVYQAMLAHPRAWSDPGMKMKLPFDYVVSGLRALGIDRKGWQDTMSADGDIDQPGEDESLMQGAATPMDGQPEDQGGITGGPPAMAATADDGRTPIKPLKGGRKNASFVRTMTTEALRRMGQPVWAPPSPAGFEEGVSTWLSPSQLSERILWARKAATSFGVGIDPREFLKTALADMARDDTARVVQQAPNRASGIMLALSSPEFNRR